MTDISPESPPAPGPASTPVITVTTPSAAGAAATLRRVADTIKFS